MVEKSSTAPESVGPSREALDALLERLGPDRQRGAERYRQLHDRLTRLYEWRACPSPEELADETLDRVASKLADGVEIHSPDHYVNRVAWMVFREIVRREKRRRLSLGVMARERSVSEQPAEEEPEGDGEVEPCFRRCLTQLEREDRGHLLRYYEGEKSNKIRNRRSMAEELGLAAGTLRIRMFRLRKRLESCIERCLALETQ